jgi:hypothetical protein
MSAHAKLAAATAAQAAMTKLLRRIGRENLMSDVVFECTNLLGGSRYYVVFPIKDGPGHFAQVWSECNPGKPARVSAMLLSPVEGGAPGCWRDIGGRDWWCRVKRLMTPCGFMQTSVDTMARLLLAAMKKEEVGA